MRKSRNAHIIVGGPVKVSWSASPRLSGTRRCLSTLLAPVLCASLMMPVQAWADDPLPREIKRLILIEDYAALLPQLERLAKHGHAEAQYQLGLLHLQGKGMAKDADEALFWFETAARQQHADALYNAAVLLLDAADDGEGSVQAQRYLQQAAAQGHVMAERRLSRPAQAQSVPVAELAQRLRYAVKRGALAEVHRYLQQGADVNSQDSAGRNALQLAIENGHDRLVEPLLAAGADRNAPDKLGNTALHYAVQKRNARVLSQLLKGAELERRNQQGQTPLLLAVALNEMELAQRLLQGGANPQARDQARQTPYDIARIKGNQAMLRLLARHGVKGGSTDGAGWQAQLANIRAQLQEPQYQGWDALMLAAWLGETQVVEGLLAQPAGMRPEVASRYEAARLALQGNHPALALRLTRTLQRSALSEAQLNGLLAAAIEADAYPVFAQLYRQPGGARPDNDRLLALAIEQERTQVVEFLATQGVRAGDHAGQHAVHSLLTAAAKGALPALQLLVQQGGALDHTDEHRRSALWYAADGGHLEAARLLLERSADVNRADVDGHTPLIRAIYRNDPAMLELLMQHGARLDSVTANGNTPLITAAEKASADVVATLLQALQQMNKEEVIRARNHNSYTALMLAVKRGDAEVVELLLQAGANPKRKSKEGKSAIEMAADPRIATLLEEQG